MIERHAEHALRRLRKRHLRILQSQRKPLHGDPAVVPAAHHPPELRVDRHGVDAVRVRALGGREGRVRDPGVVDVNGAEG